MNRPIDRIKNGLEWFISVGLIMHIKSSEVNSEFIRGNVPDIIYPIANYVASRAIFIKKPSLISALSLAALGTFTEIGQKFQLYPGTYDINDIPCYFIGAALAYGIDKLTYKQEKKKERWIGLNKNYGRQFILEQGK